MSLDFVLLGALALGFYSVTYFLIRRRAFALHVLLSRIHGEPVEASRSVIMNWAFRGRRTGQDGFAHLFTVFPPLMLLVTASGQILVFLTAIAFLRVPTSFGALVSVLLLAFPFYRAADAFDIYLMSRVAERAPISKLSEDDRTLLETADVALAADVRYFGRLSLLILLVLPLIFLYDPITSRLLNGALPALAGGLLSFAGLTFAVLTSTLTIPKMNPNQVESDETLEVAAPMAGDHLSYGTVPHLEATRNRLMKRYRPCEASEDEPSGQS